MIYTLRGRVTDAAGLAAMADVLVTVQAPAEGHYYVDQDHVSASDANPGTEALPWRTIQRAAELLVPGDTAWVKHAAYFAAGGSWTSPALNPARSGLVGAPIAFRAYPGHRPLIYNNAGPDDSSDPLIGAKDRSHIIWDGFEVTNSCPKNAVINGSAFIHLLNCDLHGARATSGQNCECIRVENSQDCLLRSNLFRDVDDGAGSGDGVKMYSSSRIMLEHNEAYDVGDGLRNKEGGTGNVYRYNWVHDCRGSGIALDAINNSTVQDDEAYGNIVVRCGRHGIKVQGSSNNHDNTRVYHNTVARNGSGGVHKSGDNVTNMQVWDNIIVDDRTDSLIESGVTYLDYNLFHQAIERGGPHNVVADPQFADVAYASPDDFRLQPGSPALGAGRNGEDLGAYANPTDVIGRV